MIKLYNPIQEKNIESIATVSNVSDTKEIYKKIDELKVQIIFPKEMASDKNAINCCSMLLNIFPRFLNNVSYDGPNILTADFPQYGREKIIAGKLRDPTLTIVFGNDEYKCENDILYVGSTGWSIYISTNTPCSWIHNSNNPLSAFYAAGLVIGEAYKYLLSNVQIDKIKHFEYDLITHGSDPQPVLEPEIPNLISFDNFALVGCGAIGQAFIFGLKFATKISGTIILIDPDNIDTSNFQRYVYTDTNDENKSKVQILAKLLSKNSPTLSPIPLQHTYEFFKTIGLSFKEVVTAVDNIETRINVQAGLPKIVWNTWTDTSNYTLRYGVSHHIMNGSYQCLACAYYPNKENLTQSKLDSMMIGISESRIQQNDIVTKKDIEQIEKHTNTKRNDLLPNIGKPMSDLLYGLCGVYTRRINNHHEPTPAPHVPLLSGIFLATQIILSKIPSLPNTSKLVESSAEFSALHIPNEYSILKHRKNKNCFCGDDIYQKIYNKKWM